MNGFISRSQRFLIVDDNQDTARSLGFILEMSGHEIEVVHDGPAALAVARTFQPHAVVLDLGLPGMDGFEVARRLRSLPAFADTFLVASSGFNTEKHRRLASEAGIDAYFVKPFDPWRLEKILTSGRPTARAIRA